MSFFRDVEAGKTVFKNEDALDQEWVPKLLPYREGQQQQIVNAIKPLLQGRNGRNVLITGTPGIGKTAAMKWVLRDLEENADDVEIIYVNCWQKNTTYKIYVDICEKIGYKFTQNKNTEELFRVIQNILNKKAAVFAFDEIDKVQDVDFLYSIVMDIFKKTIFMITNYPEWYAGLEERIRSRITPERLNFPPYSQEEVAGILKQRLEFAFIQNAWKEEAFAIITNNTGQTGDVRAGLYLLRETGLIADEEGSRRITEEHANASLEKLSDFSIKDPNELGEDEQLVLRIVKQEKDARIGDLYKTYEEKGGQGTYKTFQRRVEKLSQGGFISTKKIVGGKEGTTTMVSAKNKNLDEY